MEEKGCRQTGMETYPTESQDSRKVVVLLMMMIMMTMMMTVLVTTGSCRLTLDCVYLWRLRTSYQAVKSASVRGVMKALRRVEDYLHSFLTLALDTCKCFTSRRDRFNTREKGHLNGLHTLEKQRSHSSDGN